MPSWSFDDFLRVLSHLEKDSVFSLLLMTDGSRTVWSTIQGVVKQVILNQLSVMMCSRLEIMRRIIPDLYDTKSYYRYQLIISATK